MFGFLKNLLRKPPESSVACAEPATPASRTLPAPPRQSPGQHNGRGMELPLQKILGGLPLELQPRVIQPEVGGMTISVPLEKVLAQLSRGVVKISFGELRQAAPEVFSWDTDRDRVLVALPLAEILARLNPVLIARRRAQRHVEVPSDISSPFDTLSQGLIFAVGPAQAEAEPVADPLPRRQTTLTPPTPVAPLRNTITFAPPPVAPSALPRAFAAQQSLPPPPAPPPVAFSSAPSPVARRHLQPFPSPTLPGVRPLSMVPPDTAPPEAPAQSLNHFAPPPAPSAPPPAPQPVETPADGQVLCIGLSLLAESWPDSVRKEIVDSRLVDTEVSLPAGVVERALKQGRIAFTWKSLRSWLKPAPMPAPSAHDGLVLELPLRVVAPLFLERQRKVKTSQQKIAVDKDIPDLFFGFPRPEPAAATPAPAAAPAPSVRPSDTNYYTFEDTIDAPRAEELAARPNPTPGTKFIAKYATPNEVVSRAASLEGVAGALIALPDGLMVASRLSPGLNADTLAAFLPQIFAKVSQCTKELRMGELNNLNFTVGNVPWKIFRVNAIFFAAFGRPSEPLPTAQLAALAAELDHKQPR